MLIPLVSAIGETDCEAIGSGILAQPANAISSLAFTVFGLVILFSVSRSAGPERTNRSIIGILMIATGIGSVLFHGPQGSASHFLHDVTILVTMTAMVTMNVAGLLRWSEQRIWLILGGTALVISVVLLIWPPSTNVIAGIALVAVVVQDIALHRFGSVRTGWWIGAIVAMAVALLFFALGRTGGPVCDSSSLFQGHALWHVLSATALWAYFIATTPSRLGITK